MTTNTQRHIPNYRNKKPEFFVRKPAEFGNTARDEQFAKFFRCKEGRFAVSNYLPPRVPLLGVVVLWAVAVVWVLLIPATVVSWRNRDKNDLRDFFNDSQIYLDFCRIRGLGCFDILCCWSDYRTCWMNKTKKYIVIESSSLDNKCRIINVSIQIMSNEIGLKIIIILIYNNRVLFMSGFPVCSKIIYLKYLQYTVQVQTQLPEESIIRWFV